jgi:hypothetical protein
MVFLTLIFCFIQSVPRPAVAADRPNIILLLADDLGYAEIGVNGCKDIPTPSIDAIAHNGVRFTDGYAGHCVCAPTRAALMSGMYQHRFGFEFNPGPEASANPEFGLPRNIPSLPEMVCVQTSEDLTTTTDSWEGLIPTGHWDQLGIGSYGMVNQRSRKSI